MHSSVMRVTFLMAAAVLVLVTGCADAIREGAVGGIGSAVEGAVEQAAGALLLPWQWFTQQIGSAAG